MIFPQIKIISQDKTEKFGILYKCQIDWSEIDNLGKSNMISWYNILIKSELNAVESNIFGQMLEEVDWSENNYPSQLKDYYDKWDIIYITPNYYNELEHLRNSAISECERVRSFDTNVRDKLLEASNKFVELYFYLLSDAIQIFNKWDDEFEGFKINHNFIFTICLYRFWKNQTVKGLVINRSFYPTIPDIPWKEPLREILKDNLKWKPFVDRESTNTSNVPDFRRHIDTIRSLVKGRIRDNKINHIIND